MSTRHSYFAQNPTFLNGVDTVPVPAWHAEIILKRLAELDADPDSAIPWDQAREEIVRRLGV